MNWIGGARNRVKFQNERKTQKDFFERRRLNLSRFASYSNQPWPKKRKLSQDLMALHTVSTFHSRAPSPGPVQRQVKSVDLDKFKSCTQHFKEVDMGPVSPTHTASNVTLIDCMGDNQKQTVGNGTSIRSNIHFSTTSELSSKLRSENIIQGTKEKGEKWIKPEKRLFSIRKHQDDNKANYVSHDCQFDPFVSEDFQCTPLMSYGTKRKKKYSGKYDKSKLEPQNHLTNAITKDHRVTKSSGKFSYTSTPFNEVSDCPRKAKGPFKQVLEFDISPIVRVRHDTIQNRIHMDFENQKIMKLGHPTYSNSADLHGSPKILDAENKQMNFGWDEGGIKNKSHTQQSSTIVCNEKTSQQLRSSKNILNRRLCIGDTPECSLGYKSDSDRSSTSLKFFDSMVYVYQRENSLSTEIPANRKSELPQTVRDRSIESESVKCVSPAECKLTVQKPNLDDFDEEFEFTPKKDVCNFSKVNRKEPNILSLYADLDDTNDAKISKFPGKIRSLETGEEIQSHLQKNRSTADYSSDVYGTATEVIGENINGKASAHQQEMNDLLQEMKQLEEEEVSLKKTSQELKQTLISVATPPDLGKGSESFEADRYLESEQSETLNDLPQSKISLDEPGKIVTEPEYIAVPLNCTCTFSPSTYIAENHCNNKLQPEAYDEYTEDSNDRNESSTMTKHSETRENDTNIEVGDDSGKTEDSMKDLGDNIDTDKAGDIANIGVKVQDPEVSSGKNRGVQCNIKLDMVDRGTSPVIFNSNRDFVFIGTQFDKIYIDVGSQCD